MVTIITTKTINMLLLRSNLSHVQLYVTLWTAARQAPLSMGFSRQEYWSRGCHALLQGIFPIQVSNPHFFCLLHWQAGSLPQMSPEKPAVLNATWKTQAPSGHSRSISWPDLEHCVPRIRSGGSEVSSLMPAGWAAKTPEPSIFKGNSRSTLQWPGGGF